MAECRTVWRFTCVFLLCILLESSWSFNLDTTIPIIKEGPTDSYFGYSVAQHQQIRTDTNAVVGNFLIVGAPNLDIPFSKENNTGGLYKCNALSPRSDDCELLLSDQYGQASTADKGRNYQWLGVSVRSGGTGKAVVGCAHRYKITDNNYGLGMCYHMTQDLTFDPSMAKGTILMPCKGYSTRNEHKDYAFCQSGTSSYVNDAERCAIGSPGAIQWRGMISEFNISPQFGIKKIYRSMTTNSDPGGPPVNYYSYLGYAVTSGIFDSTNLTYYVASAPRSTEAGQVVFFTEMKRESLLEQRDIQKLTGTQAFSGFGHDLLAVDINNDGYDDLIVGCPFYQSQETDNIRAGGAVYIYSGKGELISSLTVPQIIKGRSMSQEECDRLECLHSRFGFSLAKAGDLNMDGYQDFAIGAPFEGKGAVYIYHGSPEGVDDQYSQRIYATDLSTGWQTFGYSLSGGMDLDQNTYPDLLVGSYTDNKIALLRTRPIIRLYSNISVTPENLDMSSDDQKKCEVNGVMYYCVEIKLCLRYTAEPVERFRDPVDIIYEIVAEPDRIKPRMEFRFADKSSSKVEEQVTLLNQQTTGLSTSTATPRFSCTTKIAYLKDSITDVLSEISFGISYRLPERTGPISTPSPGALPDINEYPILDAGASSIDSKFTAEVNFKKPCGKDQICKSNLQMQASVDLNYTSEGKAELELGQIDVLEVKIDLENVGEIAYQATFYMSNPLGLKFQKSVPRDIGCDRFNDTMVECKDFGSKELGRPFKEGAKTEFTILFEISDNTLAQVRAITLVAWVNTTSMEVTPIGDTIRIPIVVYIKTDLIVIGKSAPDSAITYSGEVRGESAMNAEYMIGPGVNHTYTILNNGGGIVNSSEVTIYWPYELASSYAHGKHLLYLMQPPQVLDGGDAFCFDQPEIINVAEIPSNPGYSIINPDGKKRKRRAAGDEPQEINRNDRPNIGESRQRRKSVTLNCQSKTAKCHEIRCRIGSLGKNKDVKILIRARLWESTLLEDFRDVDQVIIQSMAKIHIRKELNVVQTNTDNDIDYAESVAIPSLLIVAEKPLEWWIIALAVLGGILLLILLALCLWKCGFFKRTRYDDPTTYNVKFEKRRDVDNPTYATKVETQKDYEERDYFLKH